MMKMMKTMMMETGGVVVVVGRVRWRHNYVAEWMCQLGPPRRDFASEQNDVDVAATGPMMELEVEELCEKMMCDADEDFDWCCWFQARCIVLLVAVVVVVVGIWADGVASYM
jgi:hypothetical protein